MLILDPQAQKVTETNQAADRLLGRRRAGRPGATSSRSSPARAANRSSCCCPACAPPAGPTRSGCGWTRKTEGHHRLRLPLPAGEHDLLLVRLGIPVADANAIVLPKAKTKLLKLVENVPDGFVVTGQDGRILDRQRRLPRHGAAGERGARRWASRWSAGSGQPGVELDVLIANLRQRGPVRLFATTMRGEYGATTEVEISAVSVMNGERPCYGFAIRDVGPRVTAPARASARTPRSVEQLTELIGRVPLKDLVRETTDVIERLCIEAALELTGDNRASAAEMLGLSRQSLYVKLRRFGLGRPCRPTAPSRDSPIDRHRRASGRCPPASSC